MVSISNKPILGGETTPTLLKTKKIGDQLQMPELNAIIYLLRNNTKFNDILDINNGELAGNFGNYVFNLDSLITVDNGFIGSDKIWSKPPTVKLVNPLFEHSKYVIYLKIYWVDMLNIGISQMNGNSNVFEISIELKKDNEIEIPLKNYGDGAVLDFDAKVVITHDIPEIMAH